MHNLINEEEFIKKKKFNTWKRVMICCSIGAVQASGFFVFIISNSTFTSNDPMMSFYRIWLLLNVLFPLVLVFGMVFYGKKMIKLPLKTLLLSLLCVASVYSLVFVLFDIINAYIYNRDAPIDDLFFSIGSGITYFVIFCITVLPAARYKAKNIKS